MAPFAHLLSRAGAARAESEDDERKQREDESDEDYAKRMEELDEKERAEEEEREREAARARDEGNDVDGDDTEAEDGDDETDDAKKAARATERARCARIMAHGIATGNVKQAAVFAFNTKVSSAVAIQALGAANAVAPQPQPQPQPQPAARRPSLDERMAHVRTPNPGTAANAAEPTLAEQIITAGKIRRGEQ
ncbi:hypothetical protein [Burkholderia vietnamiensis]|uniref:hypothetical protein n=1 Tax=Burkholderia vietnamiensis TaxID=60552 RepID=UPI001CF4BC6F|nr:hypothetical protein [Burkholderia vietnamiensis]MCA8264805.1 hypothetical protein [Burkholderia vietnamiensis]HDR8927882.1 hypothetical protein [Burkholderia vietnamiensis]